RDRVFADEPGRDAGAGAEVRGDQRGGGDRVRAGGVCADEAAAAIRVGSDPAFIRDGEDDFGGEELFAARGEAVRRRAGDIDRLLQRDAVADPGTGPAPAEGADGCGAGEIGEEG